MANDKEALQRKAQFRQYLAVSVVNLLGISMGTAAGWTSPMQPLLTSAENPIGPEPLSEETFALLGSIGFISSGITTVIWGQVADRLGRRLSLLLVAVPYILSWLFVLLAYNTELLVLGRFISGIGIAGTVVIVPVYTIEVANSDLRGFLSSFLGLSINVGILIAFILGSYLGYYGLAIISLAFPIVFVLTFVWLPETPAFIWKKGNYDEAERSLLWYRGGDVVKTEQDLSEFKLGQNKEKDTASFKSLFATRVERKAFFLAISIVVAVQASGIFPIFNFTESIFLMSGASLSPSQSAIVIAIMQLIASCFCSVLIERIGRKPLFIGSLLSMAIALFVLGMHLYIAPVGALSWLPLASLSLHVISYSLGGGPVAFIVITEIFPSRVKCFATSLMHFITAFLAFVLIQLFPDMLKLIKPHGCFFLFCCCCLLLSLLFYFQLPETKGKSENEIVNILNGKPLIEKGSRESEPLDTVLHSVNIPNNVD